MSNLGLAIRDSAQMRANTCHLRDSGTELERPGFMEGRIGLSTSEKFIPVRGRCSSDSQRVAMSVTGRRSEALQVTVARLGPS